MLSTLDPTACCALLDFFCISTVTVTPYTPLPSMHEISLLCITEY